MPKPLNLVPTRLNNEEKAAIDDPKNGLSGAFLEQAVLPLLNSDATDGGRFKPNFYEIFKEKVSTLEGQVVKQGWIEGFYPSILISRGEDIILALLALNKLVDTKDPEIIKAVANVMKLEIEPERQGRIARYRQNRERKAAQKTLTAMLTPDTSKPGPTPTPGSSESQAQTQPLAKRGGSLKPGLDSALQVIKAKMTKQEPEDVGGMTPDQNTELIVNSVKIILSTGYVGEVVLERISTNLDVLSIALHEAELIKRRTKSELNMHRQQALDELDRLQRAYTEAMQLRNESNQRIAQFEEYRRQQGDRLEPYDLRRYVDDFHTAARANVVLREVLTAAGIGESRLDTERILLEAHHAHVESTLDIATVAAMRTTTALAALGLGIEVCVRTVTSQAFRDARQREYELQMARFQLQVRAKELQTGQYKIGSIMLPDQNMQAQAQAGRNPQQLGARKPMGETPALGGGQDQPRRPFASDAQAETGPTKPMPVAGKLDQPRRPFGPERAAEQGASDQPVRREMPGRPQTDEGPRQGDARPMQRPGMPTSEEAAATPMQRPGRLGQSEEAQQATPQRPGTQASEQPAEPKRFGTRPLQAEGADNAPKPEAPGDPKRFATTKLGEEPASKPAQAAPESQPQQPPRLMRLVPRINKDNGGNQGGPKDEL